tara:strand:+ start:925 stop:1065 length:141 start_codon:yes stop_codon:yes gene_type:complete
MTHERYKLIKPKMGDNFKKLYLSQDDFRSIIEVTINQNAREMLIKL